MTLLLLSSVPAYAAAWHDPARTPEAGFIEATLSGERARHDLDVVDCTGDNCDVVQQYWGTNLRLGVRPHEIVGVWGQATLRGEELKGTDHEGGLVGAAAGLNVTLPLDSLFRPALALQGEWHRSPVTGHDEAASTDKGFHLEAALFATWGDDAEGFVAYGGPAVRFLQNRELTFTQDEVSFDVEAWIPVGLVVGGEVVSDKLGLPWVERTPRLAVGLEGRALDAWSLEAWVALRY